RHQPRRVRAHPLLAHEDLDRRVLGPGHGGPGGAARAGSGSRRTGPHGPAHRGAARRRPGHRRLGRSALRPQPPRRGGPPRPGDLPRGGAPVNRFVPTLGRVSFTAGLVAVWLLLWGEVSVANV